MNTNKCLIIGLSLAFYNNIMILNNIKLFKIFILIKYNLNNYRMINGNYLLNL